MFEEILNKYKKLSDTTKIFWNSTFLWNIDFWLIFEKCVKKIVYKMKDISNEYEKFNDLNKIIKNIRCEIFNFDEYVKNL